LTEEMQMVLLRVLPLGGRHQSKHSLRWVNQCFTKANKSHWMDFETCPKS